MVYVGWTQNLLSLKSTFFFIFVYEELHIVYFFGNLIAMDFHLSENPSHFFSIDKNIVQFFNIVYGTLQPGWGWQIFLWGNVDQPQILHSLKMLYIYDQWFCPIFWTRLGFFNLVKNHTFSISYMVCSSRDDIFFSEKYHQKPVLAMWASNHSFRRVSQPTGGEDLWKKFPSKKFKYLRVIPWENSWLAKMGVKRSS